MKTLVLVAAIAGCAALAACSGDPQPVSGNSLVSPQLDSGVTSSNGGGQRALGNTPSVGVGTNGTTGGVSPNQRGNSY